jgi:hypothetical protein
LKIAPDEEGLSCTRLKITSPRDLLGQLHLDGIDPQGWMVCRILVADVEKLGLTVRASPTDRDPGHCEIRGTPQQSYTSGVSSKLAKGTRILTDDEVETLVAGGEIFG